MLYLCFIYILILRLHFSVGVRKCQVCRHSMENIALIFHMKKVAVEGKEKRIWMNREGKGKTKKTKTTQNNSNGNQDSKSNKISDDDGFFISTTEDDRIVLFLVQNYNVQRQPTFT